MREGVEEEAREGNVKGGTLRRTLASTPCTGHETTHIVALETLILQINRTW